MDRRRKYILIIGTVLLLAGAAYRFGPDPGTMFGGNETQSVLQKQLEKYRNIVQEKDQLEAELKKIEAVLQKAESALLTGDTPALAAVEIQTVINEIARQSEVEIRSMQILNRKKETQDVYNPIPVQVNLNAGIRQLKDIFYRIETAPKLLRITEIRIRPAGRRQLETIQATFTVEGYIKETLKTAS